MTPSEIRNVENSCDDGAWQCAEWLREIAAQLAEIKAETCEARSDRVKQDEKINSAMGSVTNMTEKMTATIRPLAAPAPFADSNIPEHLSCFLKMSDGTYGLAIDGEIISVEMEDARRILTIIRRPEGKPQ